MENINLCNAGEQTEDNLDIGAVAGGKYPFLLEIKLDKMISLLKTWKTWKQFAEQKVLWKSDFTWRKYFGLLAVALF